MPDYRWNEKAAIQLAHLTEEVRKCSVGISYITSLPRMPSTNDFAAYKAAIKYIRNSYG
ncbi:MAG: hypothetical protein ACKE51_08470 [Methylococcaceae bacterium]